MSTVYTVVLIWIVITLYETYSYFWFDSIKQEAKESMEQIKEQVGIEKLNKFLLMAGVISIAFNFLIIYTIYSFYPTQIIILSAGVYVISKLIYTFLIKQENILLEVLEIGSKTIIASMTLTYIILG
jgi:hypothetical protein